MLCFWPFWPEQLSTHLGDANSIHPLVQGPDIIAAQILDVLRLLLDLWMLQKRSEYVFHHPPAPKGIHFKPQNISALS